MDMSSLCLYVCSHNSKTTRPNFTKNSAAVARSTSDGVLIRYVLPVLRMTSCVFLSGDRISLTTEIPTNDKDRKYSFSVVHRRLSLLSIIALLPSVLKLISMVYRSCGSWPEQEGGTRVSVKAEIGSDWRHTGWSSTSLDRLQRTRHWPWLDCRSRASSTLTATAT